MKALKCRECGREYPLTATHVCEFDFGPLEVAYDYDRIKRSLTRAAILSRPKNMWRYRELLPVAGEPTVGVQVGGTPLIKANRLAKRLGIRELYIKNDTVNYPTLSFKDRVVSVALSRARELGFTTVACASTGNLANSVAANAAAAGPQSLRLHPQRSRAGQDSQLAHLRCRRDRHQGSLRRSQPSSARRIAGKFGWAFVNVNMRPPHYSEDLQEHGLRNRRTTRLAFSPQHTVVPMASGSLLTKIHKSYQEFAKLGLVPESPVKIHGAQATGCSPISVAQKAGHRFLQARQAEHHCQVPLHRHPGGRLLRSPHDEGNRRRCRRRERR